MSGSKSVSSIALSNTQITDKYPAGSDVGQITITMSDGTKFAGTLTLSGTYASLFTINGTRDPYAISSVSLDNATLAPNPAVGSRVGTINVVMSDQGVFTGTLSVNDTAHFGISGSDLVTSGTLTNGTNYNIAITATDTASSNVTLVANLQIAVQSVALVPGPLTAIASPAQTTTTMDVTWAPPTTGGGMDSGIHQIQYKTNASSTWLNATAVTYCTPGSGSIVDATGATWTVDAAGKPSVNGIADASTVRILYRIGALIWQDAASGAGWWSTPGGQTPVWTFVGATSPLRLTISGLVAATPYNIRGYASNSTGAGVASAAVNVGTLNASVPSAPTGLQVTAPSNTTARVVWQTPSGTPATGYIVQYKRAVDATYTNAPAWLESINGTQFTPGSGSAVTGTTPPQTVALNASGGTTVNGVADGGAAVLGVYWTHAAYVNNAANEWYRYLGTAGSYSFVGTGASADPRLTIPADTSFTQVISGLTASTAYNFRVVAFNAVGNSPASSVVNVTTPSGTVTGAQPPVQSANVGYNTLVFNSDFDSQSEVANEDGSGTAQWWTRSPDASHPRDSWTIANSILSVNLSSQYASSLTTARAFGVPIKTPGSNAAQNTNGIGFRYGYFEAKMRFNSGTNGSGEGWPSWWATCFHAGGANGDELEIDFMENQGPNAFNNGFINWFGGQTPGLPYGDYFGSLFADGYPNWSTEVAAAGLDLNGGWNVFGCLWTPSELSFWWNSFARRQSGIADRRVAFYPTNTAIHGAISNNPSRPYFGTIAGATNGNSVFLIIGGNPGKNVQFDWIHVFQ